MDGVSNIGSGSTGDVSIDLDILKKTQDVMKENAAALLAALPPPPQSPSPPGVGGKIDIRA